MGFVIFAHWGRSKFGASLSEKWGGSWNEKESAPGSWTSKWRPKWSNYSSTAGIRLHTVLDFWNKEFKA